MSIKERVGAYVDLRYLFGTALSVCHGNCVDMKNVTHGYTALALSHRLLYA